MDNDNTLALALGPELTIAQASACRDQLVDALCSTQGDLSVDLSGVTDLDSAGVQLLLSLRRSVAARGGTLKVQAATPTVHEALAVFGLEASFEALSGEAA